MTIVRHLFLLSGLALLVSCSLAPTGDGPPAVVPSGPLAADPIPRVEPRSRYGNPSTYAVFGRSYRVLGSSIGYSERGIASWYGRKFHGRRTSSGEAYDMHRMTAAHRSLPLPTYVEVKNLDNGARAIVRVNDRGPFHDNRVIDLSYAAARRLGILANGTGLVELRAIDPRASSVLPTPVAARRAPEPGAADSARSPQSDQSATRSDRPATDREPSSTLPRIYLQAGAFLQQENAHRLMTRLDSITQMPVSVEQLNSSTLPMHRVRIGPLPDVVAADRLTRQMVEAGLALPQIVIE